MTVGFGRAPAICVALVVVLGLNNQSEAVEVQRTLVLTTATDAPALPSGKMADVRFVLDFEVAGLRQVEVFPRVAELRQRAGWVGPWWDVTAEGPDKKTTEPVEVRDWYGPPPMPPAEAYWNEAKVTLKLGGRHHAELQACWIPKSLLRPEHVALDTLDPENMDGLRKRKVVTDRGGALIFARKCQDLAKEMKTRTDFLRPGVVLFFPGAGRYQLRFGYEQAQQSFYKCVPAASKPSNAVELTVP